MQIRGDLTNLNKALVANLHPTRLGGMGKKAGRAVGIGLGAGLAVGAAGAGLFKLGKSFDEQFDKIRVGTGKTGISLKGLEGDFKDVAKSVPDSFEDSGTAITQLQRRLGLTGKPLRDLSTQFLQLSRITGTDLSANIESVARAFEDWEVKDQSEALDGLFRLGQKSGASVEQLAASVQKFGSPLRILGFSLGEAAATFATFERAGVNTQTMVPGLKLAIANLTKPTADLGKRMAQLGIDAGKPEEGLRKVFALLGNESTLTDVEKTTLAMEVFGKRAGADMAEAIRQGRFEVDAMFKTFGKGDTIAKATRDTEDFTEQWNILKNRVFIGLEPIATNVFKAIGDGMTFIGDHLDTFKALAKVVGGLTAAFISYRIAVGGANAVTRTYAVLAGTAAASTTAATASTAAAGGSAAAAGAAAGGAAGGFRTLAARVAAFTGVAYAGYEAGKLLGTELSEQGGGSKLKGFINVVEDLGTAIKENLEDPLGNRSDLLGPIKNLFDGPSPKDAAAPFLKAQQFHTRGGAEAEKALLEARNAARATLPAIVAAEQNLAAIRKAGKSGTHAEAEAIRALDAAEGERLAALHASAAAQRSAESAAKRAVGGAFLAYEAAKKQGAGARELAKLIGNVAKANSNWYATQLNVKRALGGLTPVTGAAKRDLGDLLRSLKGISGLGAFKKFVVTADISSVNAAVRLIGQLKDLGRSKTALRIIAESKTPEEALKRLRKLVGDLRDRQHRITMRLKDEATLRLEKLKRFIDRMPEKKTLTFEASAKLTRDTRRLLNFAGQGQAAKSLLFGGRAKGGTVKRNEALTLVGEEGPELAKLPGGKQTIVGQAGPEIRHLPTHTRVFSHTETKRKLKSVVEKVTRVLPESLPQAVQDAKAARLFPLLRDRQATGQGTGAQALPSVIPSVRYAPDASLKSASANVASFGHAATLPTPSLATGGVVQVPAPQVKLEADDPTLQVIRVPGGQHVAVQQTGNLPPKIIRVEDSLRTLVDKPAKARVSELSTVRDRTVRSLVTEAVRRSDTKRESTSHRTSSRQSSVFRRVAKQLGIQAFAKGGVVRGDKRKRDRLSTQLVERFGLDRAESERLRRFHGTDTHREDSRTTRRSAFTEIARDVLAKTTKRIVSSKTLVGEQGYELAELPGGGAALVGAEGPEVRDLPVGTRVLPHRATRRVLDLGVPTLGPLPQADAQALATGGIVRRKDEEDRDPTARGKGQPDRGAKGSGGKVPFEDKRALRGATASVSSGIPTRANKLDRLGLPYKWGGGHGNIGQALKSGFDCSGAVSYVLGIPARVSGQFSGWGKPGPGEVATYSNAKHVVMSIGSKLFGTGDDTGPHWLSGGPGPRFSAPFTTRHIGQAGERGGFGKDGKDAPAKPKRITGGSLSLGQMVTLAKQAGFPDPALAAAVGYAESRGKVGAIGDGGDSIGLWQINMPAHPRYKEVDLKDARKNAKAALSISKGGKNWQPWTQYRTGAYKPFLGGKSTPLPGGGGGGVTARGTSDADYLAWKLQEAEATEGTTKDDLRWINRGLRYWRKVLQRSKKAGNYKRASEALSQVKDLRDKKKGLRDVVDEDAFTLDEVSSLNAGTVKWNIAGLQPQLDRLDLDIGKAALTENLDAAGNVTPDSYSDDIAAATGLRDFWQNVYDMTIGKLDLGMQVKAVQGDPSTVKRLADGRFSTKVGNRTYTFSATPGDTITVGGKKVTVPGGPELEKRPGIVLGTGKQQLEAATSLKSARDALRSVQDEMKSEAVSSADAEAKPDFAEELKKFLAAFARIGPEFGPNFKSLPSFAKGGVSRHSLALVGEQGFELAEKGRQIAAVGVGGPEIRELPVGTRVHPHDKSKRMAREMGIQGLQGGGIVAPLAAQAPARDDESLLRALARLEEAMKREPERELVEQHLHFVSPPEEQYGVQKNALAELQNSL